MCKKVFISIFLAVLCFCIFSACNDNTPITTEYGLSVSGKITCDGQPLEDTNVLVDGHRFTISNENGLFSLTGLDKGVSITFEKEGYVFYPEKYNVTDSVYDLRVSAYRNETQTDNKN